MNTAEMLKQVGKTVNGDPITEEQFQSIVDSIVTALELKETDNVLDLCCGNGLITREIAKLCVWVVGIDKDREMIATATSESDADNVLYTTYPAQDNWRLSWSKFARKAYIYEAMQYFNLPDFLKILNGLSRLGTISTVFLGSIPDHDKRWHFYDTPDKRIATINRLMNGTEQIPEWWSLEDIRVIAELFGFVAERVEQNPILHTAHYRFDVLLRREVEG